MRIRIAIAEDHTVVAEALATMLSFADGMEVVSTVSGGSDIVEVAEQQSPDVILMDITLRGLNGIEATREILRHDPHARVLILTMHDDEATVTGAIAAGAAGFLPKNVARDELVAAIRAVAEGEGVLHPKVARPFLRRAGSLAEQALERDRLTEREMSVLEELAKGRSTKEIADALIIGEETVKTHLARIYQKLGVSDRVQAVALALRRGLVR